MSRRAPDLGGRHTHPGRRPCRWLLPRRLRQPSAAGGGTYTIWDHYPQFNTISYWVKLLDSCGTQAGVTVKRTGYEDVRRAGRRQHARVYYDKTVLAKAGVDPAQIKDWTSLTAALGKVKTSDKKASPDQPWTLTLRVPAWCDDVRLTVNDSLVRAGAQEGCLLDPRPGDARGSHHLRSPILGEATSDPVMVPPRA